VGRERKSALTVLMEIVKDGNEPLCDEALELARENGRTDADSIRQCYFMISRMENYPQPLTLSTATPMLNYSPDLSAYDGLYPTKPSAGFAGTPVAWSSSGADLAPRPDPVTGGVTL